MLMRTPVLPQTSAQFANTRSVLLATFLTSHPEHTHRSKDACYAAMSAYLPEAGHESIFWPRVLLYGRQILKRPPQSARLSCSHVTRPARNPVAA